MASPQPDKFTKVSSELLEAFCLLHLSGSEWSFVHALLRKTYGYNKKDDWITNTQIMEMTGLCKERVSEAKKSLIAKNIVTEKGNKIGLQKDYEKWGKLRKNVTIVTEKRNSELRKNVTTIDSIENRQYTGSEQSSGSALKDNSFDMGWNKTSDEDVDAVVDYDGDGEVTNPQEEAKAKDRKERENIKYNLRLVEEPRGLTYNPAALNADVKVYQQLLKYGWSHDGIIGEYLNTVDDPYWKEEKVKGKYPTLKTVEFRVRNKQPS